jgi:hypothetical protein
MTSDQPRRVEIKDDGETVAAAEVTPLEGSEETVRTSLLSSSGPTPPGSRVSPVDAVMDPPEVQARSRLEATILLGYTPSQAVEQLTRKAGVEIPGRTRPQQAR